MMDSIPFDLGSSNKVTAILWSLKEMTSAEELIRVYLGNT